MINISLTFLVSLIILFLIKAKDLIDIAKTTCRHVKCIPVRAFFFLLSTIYPIYYSKI